MILISAVGLCIYFKDWVSLAIVSGMLLCDVIVILVEGFRCGSAQALKSEMPSGDNNSRDADATK